MSKYTLFFITVLTSILFSCTNSHKYQCVIELSDYSDSKFDINALSDAAAYKQAYSLYLQAEDIYSDMTKKTNNLVKTHPTGFSVYAKDGHQVPSSCVSQEALDSIRIIHQGGDLKQMTVDSTKIAQLTPYFRVTKDEFDPKAPIWYIPKSAPQYTNRNGIYCYFNTLSGRPQNFRFKIQYYADDWLFFNKVQFSIDDKAYEYIPTDTETDNGGGKIWEWCDERVKTSSDIELIRALANAKSARMKFIGRQYHDIKTISAQQILDIKRSLELYEAMGGVL